MCSAHHEREARNLFNSAGVHMQFPLDMLEGSGSSKDLDALSCYLGLILKHSDTKLNEEKNRVDQNLEGARACCAPSESVTGTDAQILTRLWLCLSSFRKSRNMFQYPLSKHVCKRLSRVVAFIVELSRVLVERKALSLRSCIAKLTRRAEIMWHTPLRRSVFKTTLRLSSLRSNAYQIALFFRRFRRRF